MEIVEKERTRVVKEKQVFYVGGYGSPNSWGWCYPLYCRIKKYKNWDSGRFQILKCFQWWNKRLSVSVCLLMRFDWIFVFGLIQTGFIFKQIQTSSVLNKWFGFLKLDKTKLQFGVKFESNCGSWWIGTWKFA